MPTVSIIIPVSPYHTHLVSRAITSAQNQTVPCTIILAQDTNGRGAGIARNAALSQITSDFVVFLDADDWITPDFIEKCLAAWKPGRYVYTGWYEDETVKEAPLKPYCDHSWHCITALIPTAYIRQVGGFDETMPGGEDTALFMSLMASGYCGIRLNEPLLFYGNEGQRGKAFYHNPQRDIIMSGVRERFRQAMACCGDNQPIEDIPVGDRQSGDVLAFAAWGGNRVERGRITGRWYPRTGNFKQVWVDPADAKARPDLWRIVEAKIEPSAVQVPAQENFWGIPDVVVNETPHTAHGVEEVAAQLWPMREVPVTPVTLESLQAVKPAEVKPDVKRVRKLAKNGKNKK